MRRILFYSSLLFLIQMSPLGSTCFAKSSLDEQIEFMIKQKTFFTLIKGVNYDHLVRHQRCLRNPEGFFVSSVVGKNAEITNYTRRCKSLIEVRFKKPFRLYYEKMRVYLSLSRPRLRDVPEVMSQSSNINYKLTRGISHPSFSAYLGTNFRPAELERLSENEIKEALRLYNEDTQEMCKSYRDKHLSKRLYFFKDADGKKYIEELFCKKSLLELAGSFKSMFIQLELRQLNRGYHRWLENQREELRRMYSRLYEETVTRYPLLIFGESADPTNAELLDILDKISEHNSSFNLKVENYILDNNINSKISRYQQGELDEGEKEDLFDDLLFFLRDSVFSSYIKKFTFNSNSSKDLKKLIDAERKKIERTDMLKGLGVLSLALGSCFIPIGKIVSVVKLAKAFKLGCFVSLGVPLNLYFLSSAYYDFNKGLSDFISSPDGEFVFGSYSKVSKSYQAIVLNTLLLGVGIGPVKELVRLSKAGPL